MKIIKKSDLEFRAGRLTTADGTIVTPYDLVDQVNAVHEMRQVVQFVGANKAALEAAATEPGEKLVLDLSKPKPVVFKTEKVAATPLLDEEKKIAEAKALEFLDKQHIEDVDNRLAGYGALARFINEDEIIGYGDVSESVMMTNPLELTNADVIETVEQYFDPEVKRLAKYITIKH